MRAPFHGRRLVPPYASCIDVVDQPAAVEGALKLKEVAYMHAEAYAAQRTEARVPLALVTSEMPVAIVVASNDSLLERLKISLQEVRARQRPLRACRQRHAHRKRRGLRPV